MDHDDDTTNTEKGDSLPLIDELDALLDRVPEPYPAMQVLTGLDLSIHGEPAKLAQANKYISLTLPVRLTTLGPAAEITARLTSLEARMPNFSAVIQSLLAEFALARRGNATPILKLRPALLIGPPGIGKTRFVRLLADALGATWSYLSTAGDSDNRRFAGTAAGYSTTLPAWPVEQILRLQRANPILILDELDKTATKSMNGQIIHSLLPLLEADTAKLFSDPCLGGQADLSAISWFILANTAEELSSPLLSRVTKFEIKPPSPTAFDTIVATIIADIAAERHIDPAALPRLPASFLEGLKAAYARAPDIRRLKSAVEKALALLVRDDEDRAGLTIH